MARLTISFYFELNICVLEVLASVSGSNNSPGNYLLSPRDSPLVYCSDYSHSHLMMVRVII